MEANITQQLQISARQIGKVNHYLTQAKKVAINEMQPVFGGADRQVIEAFQLSLEGPPKYLSYFKRLLDSDNAIRIS